VKAFSYFAAVMRRCCI